MQQAAGREAINWATIIPDEQWALHRKVLDAVRARGVRFALGGGLAFSAYSGRLRNTKDMDLFVLPETHEAVVEATREAGFSDYFEQLPYDRGWIYRGFRDGVIVDVIWQMANYRTQVSDGWLTRGPEIPIFDDTLRLLPPEELIWSKLYILQRDRCDWPDLLNILHAEGARLDWQHLLSAVGDDRPLLAGLASVYSWLCPSHAAAFPAEVWALLGLAEPAAGPDCATERHRVELIDSRDWFGPTETER